MDAYPGRERTDFRFRNSVRAGPRCSSGYFFARRNFGRPYRLCYLFPELEIQRFGHAADLWFRRTNRAHRVIPAGGFDPFVGIFSGAGPGAVFIDGTSDALSNYTSEPSAWPPAGTATIGDFNGESGDVELHVTGLTPASYTILLSDALYYPEAVSESFPAFLGDGFQDFTGDVLPFQTCVDSSDCVTDTQNWALDIAAPEESTLAVPKPSSLEPTGISIVAAVVVALIRRLRFSY